MTQAIYFGIGSFFGCFARFFVSGAIYKSFGTAFPLGTLAVNLIGCFFIGFFSALAGDRMGLSPSARLLLMTGFCGAFTTFSAFMLDTGNLLKDGEMMKAGLNVALSLIAGFLVFRLGIFLGKII